MIITVGAVLVLFSGDVLTHVQCLNVWDWSENNDNCDMLNDQNYELMSADLPPTPPSPSLSPEYYFAPPPLLHPPLPFTLSHSSPILPSQLSES